MGKIAISGKFDPLISTPNVIHNVGVLTKVKLYVSIKMNRSTDGENGILSGFNPNSPLGTDDIALDYLAELLVDIYLDELEHDSESTKHN